MTTLFWKVYAGTERNGLSNQNWHEDVQAVVVCKSV